MSFNFTWPEFSSSFIADAAAMLDSALNKGVKPKVIADDIKVEDINMGNIPPELEILEIGELSTDRFRGIFRLTYAGDAHLTLSTKVQANPLSRPAPASSSFGSFEDASSVFPSSMPSRGILFAARPLIVPMKLRLSSVRLKAIVVLVVSKQKGITLVFKNDPLESVEVSSTFDSVAVIQKYLQQEIEGQLREMFREDLPGIIHRLSQKWLSGNNREAPKKFNGSSNKSGATKSTSTPPASSPAKSHIALASLSSSPEMKQQHRPHRGSSVAQSSPSVTTRSPSRRRKSDKFAAGSTPPSPRMTHRGSAIISSSPRGSSARANSSVSPTKSGTLARKSDPNFASSFGLSRGWNSGLMDDMENYDPTYGLRPDDVRMAIHGSGYSGLARLAGQVNGGLRDLTIAEKSESDGAARATPTEVAIVDEDGESLGKADREADGLFMDEETMMHNLDWSDHDQDEDDQVEDDVPDRPHSSGSEEDQDGIAADFTMYGYPPPGAAFSDTAVENSARQSAAVFDFSSPSGESPRSAQGSARSQSNYIGTRPASTISSAGRSRKSSKVEYETIPAVGGGIITRPRIYHTASRVQAPEVEEVDEVGEYLAGGSAAPSSTARGPSSSRTYTIRPSKSYKDEIDEESSEDYDGDDRGGESGTDVSSSALGHESITTLEPEPMDPNSTAYRTQLYRHQAGRLYRAGYGRQSSLSSTLSSGEASRSASGRLGNSIQSDMQLGRSNSRSSTAPTSTYPSTQADNSNSFSNQLPPSSPSEMNRMSEMKGQNLFYSQNSSPIQPPRSNKQNGANQSMTMGASHHFMDLVNTNHTLSPFTRTLDTKGYAVRSHPVTPSTGSGGETSSSASGMATRPLNSTVSQQWKENIGYFERNGATSETGRGKRRTFKIGGGKEVNTSGNDQTNNDSRRRPGSSPIQQQKVDSTTASRRAHSTAPRYLSNRATRHDDSGSNDSSSAIRHRSRQLAHSERTVPTMGAIRE